MRNNTQPILIAKINPFVIFHNKLLMNCFFCFSFLISSTVYCQVKPKFNPNKPYKSVYMGFESLQKRVSYMKTNMAKYCISGKTYGNAFANIDIKDQLTIVDKKDANFSCLFTIKMSENSVFVFLINNICNFNGEETGEVNVTYFNYTYGDVDANSIKNLFIKKKRLFLNNNQFTEELTIGKIVFTVYDKKVYSQVSFAGQNFEIKRY
jgi:hypothetical protein